MAAYQNVWIVVIVGGGVPARPGAPARADDAPQLAGIWNWSWKDQNGRTHHHVLEIEGVTTKLAAREVFDDLPPVRVDNLVRDGKKIRFSVVRGDHRADYNGILADANSIDGKVTVTEGSQNNEYVWKARRQTKPTLPPQPEPTKPEG